MFSSPRVAVREPLSLLRAALCVACQYVVGMTEEAVGVLRAASAKARIVEDGSDNFGHSWRMSTLTDLAAAVQVCGWLSPDMQTCINVDSFLVFLFEREGARACLIVSAV